MKRLLIAMLLALMLAVLGGYLAIISGLVTPPLEEVDETGQMEEGAE